MKHHRKEVILQLGGSKTNQHEAYEERRLFHRCVVDKVPRRHCAACAALHLSKNRPRHEALVVDENNKPYVYTYAKVNDTMKNIARSFGLEPTRYTIHCMPRGGASDLFKGYNKSIHWIMVNCYWANDTGMIKTYLSRPNPDIYTFDPTKYIR